MANPLWIIGQPSTNPKGRPKSSARSVRGMFERFVRRNVTPNKLSKLFNQLNPKEQSEMLLQLLPFTLARQTPDSLSKEEVESLYHELEQALKGKRAN